MNIKNNGLILKLYYKYIFRVRHYYKGRKALKHLLSIKKKDEVYVILTNAIGDDIYGMSYVKELRKHHNGELTVLCLKNRKTLVESYPDSYDRIVTFDKNTEKWKDITSIYMSRRLLPMAAKQGIFSILPFYYLPLDFSDGRNQLELIRDVLLKLPKDVSIQYPDIKETVISSISDFKDKSDHIVVINPYSSSMDYVDMAMYEKISDYIQDKGYIVYTNVVGDQKVVKGTKPLRCSIDEFYSICNHIPLVISTRSGIIDWSISAKTNFVIFYFPFGRNQIFYPSISVFYERHTLKAWNTNNVVEYIYTSTDQSYNGFVDFVEKTKII